MQGNHLIGILRVQYLALAASTVGIRSSLREAELRSGASIKIKGRCELYLSHLAIHETC